MIANSTQLKLFFLLATLIITLFFGLYPKDFSPADKPFVNDTGDLEFSRYSIATAEGNFTALSGSSEIQPQKQTEKKDDLTLNVSLVLPQMPKANTRFSVIFSVNDAKNNSVMLLGQWKKYLVIMAGDDYPNKTGQPRITVSLDSMVDYVYPQELSIQINASQTTTTLILNEQTIVASSDFVVAIEPSTHMISLGNTLDRKQGWVGTIQDFSLKASNGDSKSMHLDLNLTPPSVWTLHSAFTVFSKQWLSLGSLEQGYTDSIKKDVAINLLGFVPISLSLFIMYSIRSDPSYVAALQTIATSASISLFIESVQILIPSRTSSLIDLATNTLSGVLTALACCLVLRRLSRRKPQITTPHTH